jgi:predicted RNase H-like nuclease (RuvC/YqgF family)
VFSSRLRPEKFPQNTFRPKKSSNITAIFFNWDYGQRRDIKQLREQNGQLRREVELLKAKISELEARLAQYENAHAPPSLRRGRNRKKDKGDKGKPRPENWA